MPTYSAIADAVAAADRQSVVETFDRLQKYWQVGQWLDRRNRYRRQTSKRVRRDRTGYRHLEMSDYIGASTIGHCFDGWSFLGRATEAELCGDAGTARHLGYYAELRAAMSLLAAEGLGVFNDYHVVVEAGRRCSSFAGKQRTHIVVWQTLDEWSGTQRGMDRVLGIVSPAGIPLAEWVGQFGGAAGFVARNWLDTWGLDLARLEADREARNESSYRPASLTGAGPRDIGKTIDALDELWTLCNPRGGGGFPVMDEHLLREVVTQLFEAGGGSLSTIVGARKYAERVGQMLDGVLTGHERANVEVFLSEGATRTTSALLLDAAGTVGPDHVDHSKQVLARATLLLRLATGAVGGLLKDSGTDFAKELRFWWNAQGVRRRLWGGSGVPGFADLWEDVSESLDEAGEWVSDVGEDLSHWRFWQEKANAGWHLTTTERVFLWGLL